MIAPVNGNPQQMLSVITEALKSPEQLEAEQLEAEEEERLQAERERKLQEIWSKRIKDEQKDHKDFRERGKAIKKVLQDGEETKGLYVPLFWSVIQVEHSGVYSSQPTPDVRPNNGNNDPMYLEASQVLERGISYYVDQQSFDNNFHRAVDDFLGQGLGIPRIKLDSKIVDQNGEEAVGDQTLRWEYVPWDNFGWEPCNSWDHCDWGILQAPNDKRPDTQAVRAYNLWC